MIIEAAELELVGIMGVEGSEASLMMGRHRGPQFKFKPALERPGSSKAKCSKTTAAWRMLASWLKMLLIHWGAEHNGTGHLPTLLNAKRRIRFSRWANLADSVNGRIFVRWAQCISSADLQDKVKTLLLYRAASMIAKAASDFDVRRSRAAWQNWLTEGPSQGLGKQHRLTRTAQGWIPAKLAPTNTLEDEEFVDADDGGCYSDIEGVTEAEVASSDPSSPVVPLNLQQATDAEAEAWGKVWQQGVAGKGPKWPKCLGEALPSITVDKFRQTCFTFPCGVGLGWDKLHPRALARCSDRVLEALIAVLMLAELQGEWFDAIGVVMVVLIAKADGGRRPIGLFPSIVRIWMRMRLDVAQQWVKDNERDYFYAGPRKGAEVAAWKQSLLAEASRMYTLPYVCTLLDLVKAFDTIPFDLLADCAAKAGYSLWLLRLSIAAYSLARVLDIEGCCSCEILASRGLAAGSVLATIELRVLLIAVGDRVVASSLYCRLTLYVDDAAIETVCTASRIVKEHCDAVNGMVKDLQELRLTLSDTKNVVCATTESLAQETLKWFTGFAITAANRIVSLGSGLGAGSRRNAKQMRKRLKAFTTRRRRFKRLRASGVRTDKLLRTGGNAAMVYGQRAMGVSNVMLHSQRVSALAVTCSLGCGGNLDLGLMLADDKSRGAADPAFEAHVGVLFEWALAVWEAWAPLALLVNLIASAKSRFEGVKSVWSIVYGPSAAVVATARRLGWSVIDATHWITDVGEELNLSVDSPAFVQDLAVKSVRRWRWRRIEQHFPALHSNGEGRGADWRTIQRALRVKDSDSWGPAQKGALKSAVAGRQWCQHRLFKAGLVEHDKCLLCKDMIDGNVSGTLLHRWVCPALANFRFEHLPKWIGDYLLMNGRSASQSSAVLLAFTRGLVRLPEVVERRNDAFDTFTWLKQAYSIPSGCVIFTDGSLLDGKLPEGHQALGWAFAVIGPEGDFIAAAYGVPPRWINTIQGAELWAVQMALSHVTFLDKLFTDCDSVRFGCRQPDSWAAAPKRRLARVWMVIKSQLDDMGEVVHWIPAHTAESSIGSSKCSNGQVVDDEMWHANQLVDEMAKFGAESVRLPLAARTKILRREAQILELVIFVGKLTHAANSCIGADGKAHRDSEADKRKRSRPKAKVGKIVQCPLKVPRTRRTRVAAPHEWLVQWQRLCRIRMAASGDSVPVTRAARLKSVKAGITSRQHEAFDAWWRDSRAPCGDAHSGAIFPPISGAISRDRSPQASGRRRRSGSSSVQFCRSFVVSQYDIPNVNRSQNVSSSDLPLGPSVSKNGGPRVPSICSDGQQCDVGFCSRCGHCTSDEMRTDAKGPCIGGSTSSGSALSHASESVSVNGTIASSSSGAISGAVRQQLGVLPRVGVSSDGCCLGCGDRMSTPMHLANGPCKE